jgi:RNA polymerase sigma-70 factor, ECF subfamily
VLRHPSDRKVTCGEGEGSNARTSRSTAELVDADLISAAKRGDREAFDALVRRSYVDTYTLAYRLTGNVEDAHDVVQEAYLRAYKGLRRFRGDAQFSTWLYRITANCAATHLGRSSRHRHEVLDEQVPVADTRTENDPQLRATANELRSRLSQALEDLPPRLRAVVVLRDVYGLPHEAIAKELGISESAAKVRLHRARNKLREVVFPRRNDRDEEETRAG